jgi:uncharacterized protein with ParB-like and HNH nuclease domain
MSYKSEPIAVAVERMNRQYFLPAIQREFVWKPEQSCAATQLALFCFGH